MTLTYKINQLEATIVQTLPIISPASNASHLRAISSRNKQGPTQRGMLIDPFGPPVPGTSAPQSSHPPSTATQAPIPPADVPEGEGDDQDDEPDDHQDQPRRQKKPAKNMSAMCVAW